MTKKNTQELLEELDERIENVKSSEEFKEMLQFFSKFHDYSYRNTILIQSQKTDATYVAGYRQWQKKFNRQVKKGEEGIAILAPYTYTKTVIETDKVEKNGELIEKEVEKEVTRTHFKPVYVFDISQTEPSDDEEDSELPILNISLDNNGGELLKPLSEFAVSQELSIIYRVLAEGTDGYLRVDSIVVDENLNDTEKASILCHELAHALLKHDGDNLSREVKEMEAEAVAFVVMDYYGIEIKSDKYLALYKTDYDLKESLKRINQTSTEIIKYCDDWIADDSMSKKKSAI